MNPDERFARELAETFAAADAVPDCTKEPARYQLYVLDQVEKRRDDEETTRSEAACKEASRRPPCAHQPPRQER